MKRRYVYVEWVDSSSRAGRVWKDGEELRQKQCPCKCASVGTVVHESAEALTVAGHYSAESDEYSGEMCIPKVAITKRRNIKVS